MPVREIVTPWDRQPQEAAGIDWGNPLARDLLVSTAMPSGGYDLVGQLLPTPSAVAAKYEPTALGVAIRSGFESGAFKFISQPATYAAAPFTLLLEFIPATTAAGQSGLWTWGGVADDGNPRLYIARAGADLRVFLGGGYQIEAAGVFVAGRRHLIIFTHDGALAKCFVNGALVGATAVGMTGGSAANWYLGSGYGGAVEGWFTAHNQWRRGISDSEVASLSANPWQLFARREYTPFVVTPSGTTYNQSISGSMAAYGAILRSVNKIAFGTINISGVQRKDTSVNRIGSLTLLANPTKLTTTSTKTGSITTASNLVGADSGVEFSQSASGSITLTSVLTDAVTFVRSWSSQVTLSGAIAKPVSKLLSGVITLTGAVSKLITKAKFTASLTLSGIATGFGFTPGPGGGALSRGIRFMRKFIGRR